MQMPARSRELGIPLGHEGDLESAACTKLLHRGLEESGLVRHAERVVVANGHLVYARARFRVEPLDGNVEGVHLVQYGMTEFAVLPLSDPRVAKHSRRERCQVAKALLLK